ncbi:MAG: hypothetical protein RJA98_1400 [Pseudomonadota bacterium]|jgi:general secretion pathway protein B
MSFILDALKRAEAEREQGRVPGLMAQHGNAGAHDGTRGDGAATGSALRWALLGVGLLIAALLLWLTFKPDARGLPPQASHVPDMPAPTQPAPTLPSAPALPPALPSPIAAAPAQPPDQRTMQSAEPAARAQTTAQPAEPQRAAAVPATTAPTPAETSAAATAQAERARAAATRAEAAASAAAAKLAVAQARAASAAEAKAAKAAALAAANAPAEKLPSLADLPPDLRAGLPALAVSGAIHSQNRADRLLIVNGVLLHEGESIAPGLVLEQIRLKSAVLRFKNQRFELAY